MTYFGKGIEIIRAFPPDYPFPFSKKLIPIHQNLESEFEILKMCPTDPLNLKENRGRAIVP